jgi:predicted aminopeptidase
MDAPPPRRALHIAARRSLATARRRARPLLGGALVLLLAGCETLGYYGQAVRGQLGLLFRARPVEAVLADPGTAPGLAERLRLAQGLRAFAEAELGIEPGGRYARFVELERDAVLYNVYAAPRYELVPVTWCFPVAGCVSYRGYFSRPAAERKARRLAEDGYDVHVGPVAAYSTLGWFDDPLLSSFIDRPPADLAELLFHELAHGVAYVPGETALNESFATFVGRQGTRRWLAARDDAAAREAWEARHRARAFFVAFVLETRETLGAAYAAARLGGADEAALEVVRAREWAALRARWADARPPEAAPYDPFFAAPASNARLNTVADYNVHVPAFAALFRRSDEAFGPFLEQVQRLAEASPEEREAFLAAPGAVARASAVPPS